MLTVLEIQFVELSKFMFNKNLSNLFLNKNYLNK